MKLRAILPHDDACLAAYQVDNALGWHAARITELVELGFEEIQLHQVGRNQQAFIDVFGERVLPALRR